MRTLVVGAAIVDLMMKIDRLPKSGEDIPCKETKTVVGGCAYNVANLSMVDIRQLAMVRSP